MNRRTISAIDNGILFLCVANSARSQIAEGLARRAFESSVHVQSAGSKPARVHPLAVEVMREVGVDISSHHSKSIDDVDMSCVGLVVTLCTGEVCSVRVFPAVHLYWFLPNPAIHMDDRLDIDCFRKTRDELTSRIERLHSEYLCRPAWTEAGGNGPLPSPESMLLSSFRRLTLRYGLKAG